MEGFNLPNFTTTKIMGSTSIHVRTILTRVSTKVHILQSATSNWTLGRYSDSIIHSKFHHNQMTNEYALVTTTAHIHTHTQTYICDNRTSSRFNGRGNKSWLIISTFAVVCTYMYAHLPFTRLSNQCSRVASVKPRHHTLLIWNIQIYSNLNKFQ